jgi:large subunit ribosomal protein L24
MHIKKGDTVTILVGKDRGKTGKVLRVFPKDSRVLVEGINVMKRHEKGRGIKEGGIISREVSIHASNVKKA